MNIRRAIPSVVIVLLFCTFNLAMAQLKTITYEGTVISTGAPGYQVPSFSIGDTFRVTFAFESGTPDYAPDDPTVGHYYNAVKSLSFEVGEYSGYVDSCNIQVGNDYTGQGGSKDYYNIMTWGSTYLHGPDVDGWALYGFVLQLQDPTGTAFASDALPLTALNPQLFVDPYYTYMSITFTGPSGASAVVANFSHISPEVALENLMTSLSDPNLELDEGQVMSLSDKLNEALLSIQNEEYKQARNQLNAFLRQVDAARKTGRMSDETADILIAAVLEIIADIP